MITGTGLTSTSQAQFSVSSRSVPGWQMSLAQAIRDPATLLERLDLSADQVDALLDQTADFPLRVPESYLRRMEPGNPQDPLLLQVLPRRIEARSVPGFSTDPVGDLEALQGKGLLHKYQGRALLITTQACAVHCRYCFRRHFPYSEQNAGRDRWQQSLDMLSQDATIREIILSGGDPLTLTDLRLAELIRELEAIPHLKRLRIHTRLPVVLPERITRELVCMLADSRFQVVVVIHANHARELNDETDQALGLLRENGITLLNQAVLLRGINDSVDAQTDLSETLFEQGVLPYYLHVLDPVQGAAHFDVADKQGASIVRALMTRLPGYLVPKLVREIAGEPNKTPVSHASENGLAQG